MALYIPHSVFHLVRLLYVRPETFGPYYVVAIEVTILHASTLRLYDVSIALGFSSNVVIRNKEL